MAPRMCAHRPNALAAIHRSVSEIEPGIGRFGLDLISTRQAMAAAEVYRCAVPASGMFVPAAPGQANSTGLQKVRGRGDYAQGSRKRSAQSANRTTGPAGARVENDWETVTLDRDVNLHAETIDQRHRPLSLRDRRVAGATTRFIHAADFASTGLTFNLDRRLGSALDSS